jgi:predicted AAA+ superfamily ATPase
MKRDIEKDLLLWKKSPLRSPLLLRGARQVGKSFVVEKFGKEQFDNLVVINFEQRPEFRTCFDTLLPEQIVTNLELMTAKIIEPGKTLLFLDEIQECPQAIMALRYFKEQMPALHLIGAGSLLEFTLNDADFSMPVGRVQFLYLHPLSFYEYLTAIGRDNLSRHLQTVSIDHPPSEAIHKELISLVREYVALGGMPAVVAAYLQTKSILQCQDVQSDILATYRRDFGKYAKVTEHKVLSLLFEKAPGLISQWFKYTKVDPDINPRQIKTALKQLSEAGLIYRIHATSASGLPLVSTQNEKKFKLLFLDVGLAKRASYLDLGSIFNEDVFLINQGLFTEQFVGQELLAHSDRKSQGALYFWVREEKNSSAEVDFVITIGSQIVPIEVKSGSTGRLKSLKIFMTEKNIPLGIRLSAGQLSLEENILSVPFYMIAELPRLLFSRF